MLLEKGTKDISASGLARVLGVGTGQTSMWKKNNTDPPSKYLAKISEYLGVSISFLVTGIEDKRDEAYTDDEQRMIERYRTLDTDGKDAVRGVLLSEYRRCAQAGANKVKTAG